MDDKNFADEQQADILRDSMSPAQDLLPLRRTPQRLETQLSKFFEKMEDLASQVRGSIVNEELLTFYVAVGTLLAN